MGQDAYPRNSQWNVVQPGSGFKAPRVTLGLASSMGRDPPPRLQPQLPDTSLRRPPLLQAGCPGARRLASCPQMGVQITGVWR